MMLNNISLTGRIAIVCGCTQGIGRAAAQQIAALGATVVAVARNSDALRQLCDELPTPGLQEHQWRAADFQDWQQVQQSAQECVDAYGPVTILVNNTGGPPAGRAIDADPQVYLDAFTQHLVCNQVLTQAVVPGMRNAGYGRVINIISTSVIAPIPNLGVSNTIRGAVANWARTLAGELGPDGITVNNVLPGFTKTSRLTTLLQGRAERTDSTLEEVEANIESSIPLRRMAEPQELGAVIAFLASPAASYVNGVNLPIDGGRTATQ